MSKVKICGLSTADTMQAALDAGADFVGLMFFDKSPRNISLANAKVLADQARELAKIVTVVVDAHDEMLMRIAEVVRPDFLQLHGSETPERIAEIKKLTRLGIIKVIKVAESADVAKAKSYAMADLIMYDSKAPVTLKDALPGGNGLAFDWSLLGTNSAEYMLAGGLNPDNVAEAIRVTGAPTVDVSSGVESTPGVKDAARIRKFIAQAKRTG